MLKLKVIIAFLTSLILPPAFSGERDGEKLIAKTKKSIKYKKKKKKRKVYIKYPHRANLSVSAEKLKMRELVKDRYE